MPAVTWYPFDEDSTIGTLGSEKGTIICDEEHPDGARITLERDGFAPFAITCGIYGWMVHTRFFSNQPEAQQAYDEMKIELDKVLGLIPSPEDFEEKSHVAIDAIGRFIERFP